MKNKDLMHCITHARKAQTNDVHSPGNNAPNKHPIEKIYKLRHFIGVWGRFAPTGGRSKVPTANTFGGDPKKENSVLITR